MLEWILPTDIYSPVRHCPAQELVVDQQNNPPTANFNRSFHLLDRQSRAPKRRNFCQSYITEHNSTANSRQQSSLQPNEFVPI